MKIYYPKDFQQRSPEWFQIRMGKFTSSNIQALFAKATKAEQKEALEEGLQFCFSKGAKTLILQKAAEILFPEPEIKGSNSAMEWGIDNEDLAKLAYQKRTGFQVFDIGFVEVGEGEGSSPDNFVNKKGLAEYKCPGQVNHLKNILTIKTAEDLKKVNPKYWYQCQHQMFCAGKDWCDFVSFHPHLSGAYSALSLHIVRIKKDLEQHKQFAKVIPLAIELRNKFFKQLTSNL